MVKFERTNSCFFWFVTLLFAILFSSFDDLYIIIKSKQYTDIIERVIILVRAADDRTSFVLQTGSGKIKKIKIILFN